MSYVDPASLHAIEDDRRAGMTGIACTGLIAATTSFLFVSYGLHAIIRYNRRTQQERTATSIKEAEQNRRSLFFRSEYGILLLNLIFSGKLTLPSSSNPKLCPILIRSATISYSYT